MSETPDYGLLNSQTDERFGNRRFGRLGTIAQNGCGLIALYNIERAADDRTRFEPFCDAAKRIKTNLFGLLGTRPSSIPQNLKKDGFTVEKIPKKDIAQAARFDGTVVLYWQWLSAHYVAGIGNEDGTYTFYNQFSTPRKMTLSEFLAYLERSKLHPVRVWGIRFPQK